MLYSGRRVKKLAARIQNEYGALLAQKDEELARIKEENTALKARNLVLEEERGEIAEALILAKKAGDTRSSEQMQEREVERREFSLLADRCRSLLDMLREKYPDREETAMLARYTEELRRGLGEEDDAPTGFNMDDVIAPKQPLDLAKLCRGLGLMEENS